MPLLPGDISFWKWGSPATLFPKHTLQRGLIFHREVNLTLFTLFTFFTLYLPEGGAQSPRGQGKISHVDQPQNSKVLKSGH